MYQNHFLNSMYTLGGMPKYLGKYLDTMATLYDYIPVDRRPRQRGLIEDSPNQDTERDQKLDAMLKEWELFKPPESGLEGEGWGHTSTPGNAELGTEGNISPGQALGNIAGLLGITSPLGPAMLGMGLMAQHKGTTVPGLFGFDGFNPLGEFDPFGWAMDTFGFGSSDPASDPTDDGLGDVMGDFGMSETSGPASGPAGPSGDTSSDPAGVGEGFL